jgi:glycosyltransferase involved in cell wall biosynthesis
MHGLSSAAASPGPAPLSAILITRNEEANIAECLASVAFAAERIVVDNCSSDRTREIAQAAGARVVNTEDWPGFGPQKNRALDLATQPWVLSIDADERVTPELRDEILGVLRAPSSDAYAIPRKSSYCGQYMAHAGWYPDYVTRLFRRGTARFSDDIVHERLVPQGPVRPLAHDLLHRTFPDFESVLDKLDRYSTAGAQRMLEQGRSSSVGRAVASGLWAFVRTYVLQRGFLDGRMGFLLAVSNAEGTYYRYLKLWLAQQQRKE